MPESLTFCGRTFRTDELELMRQMSREHSALGVTEIARTVCELLDWTRPNGGLKNQECRQLLERLQAEGFLKLPEQRKLGGRGPRRVDVSGGGSDRCPSQVPSAIASLWIWPWWTARRRVAGGASRWNGTTISDVACRSARTCATGYGLRIGSYQVC